MSVVKLSQRKLENTVDKLGEVKALIADLRRQEKALQSTLVESGLSRIEGRLFAATIVESDRTTVDTKALRETFGDAFLQPYSKTTHVTAVRVTARSDK